MKRLIIAGVVIAAILCSLPAFGITLLHEFAGGTGDGGTPYGSLTLSGSTLYGMTRGGGDSGAGVVFKVNTDGTGYDLLHEFAGGGDDGASPAGSLTLSGSNAFSSQ